MARTLTHTLSHQRPVSGRHSFINSRPTAYVTRQVTTLIGGRSRAWWRLAVDAPGSLQQRVSESFCAAAFIEISLQRWHAAN